MSQSSLYQTIIIPSPLDHLLILVEVRLEFVGLSLLAICLLVWLAVLVIIIMFLVFVLVVLMAMRMKDALEESLVLMDGVVIQLFGDSVSFKGIMHIESTHCRP